MQLLALLVSLRFILFSLYLLLTINLLPLKLSCFSLIISDRLFGIFLFSHLHTTFDSWIASSSSSFRIEYFFSLGKVWLFRFPIFFQILWINFSNGLIKEGLAPPHTVRPYSKWHLTKLSSMSRYKTKPKTANRFADSFNTASLYLGVLFQIYGVSRSAGRHF